MGEMKMSKKVSILMLIHNAPLYVLKSILSLRNKTSFVNYELVVVDNNSKKFTRYVLKILKKMGQIDKIFFNPQNDLFARGNNLAATMADDESKYFLLLNSDVKIKDKNWLLKLLAIHPTDGGISSYGAVLYEPYRTDGYCMLINSDLYKKYKLDEEFQWWWSVTKLQSQLLKENYRIIAVIHHDKQIYHYGGKSGKSYRDAKGMDINIEEVKKWFEKGAVEFIDHLQ